MKNQLLFKYKGCMSTRHFWIILAAVLVVPGIIINCEGQLTRPLPLGESFEETLPNLPDFLNAAFARGDEAFDRVFTVSEGLGPTFNQPSCATCHPADGRGTPQTLLIRFSRGSDPLIELGGSQLQDKSIPGVPFEVLPPNVDTSPRMPPPVFGMGLIEGIPDEVLLQLADPDDLDGDGISGRVNMVLSIAKGNIFVIGRFGRKANQGTLIDQVATAYHQDMGITNDLFTKENINPMADGIAIGDLVPDPEIPFSEIEDNVMYVRLLAPPNPGERTPETTRGEGLFADIGCAGCHVPTLRTGPSVIPPLDRVDVNLYSDILLHDMGPELADNRPDWEANGREWRTAPLWGLRLAGDPLGGVVHYLHDGRTTDLSEAILLHGGEAETARNLFQGLSESDKNALIAFLLSL